ncbi:MAG TPA: hypothetical protein VKB75_13350 [Jatrophihabitans sp.]|nr:hypothetical protein [Jatrophihabitans sp.]
MAHIRIQHVALALVPLDITLFVLAGIPRYSNAKHGADHVLGGIFWMGFLAGTLALLITLAIWITRTTRARRASS